MYLPFYDYLTTKCKCIFFLKRTIFEFFFFACKKTKHKKINHSHTPVSQQESSIWKTFGPLLTSIQVFAYSNAFQAIVTQGIKAVRGHHDGFHSVS